ncbi:hypothetical protein Vadar_010415 [Vaccinium darrowii]|uniref:Uncharacterized protein n=1 Tax=Vaccinium darrowii TaxID=229202 RepID=A0ACB7Z3K8_9ERIC|nr:hypothetical protein Vadar_010415 [Vaccinium darrowii]
MISPSFQTLNPKAKPFHPVLLPHQTRKQPLPPGFWVAALLQPIYYYCNSSSIYKPIAPYFHGAFPSNQGSQITYTYNTQQQPKADDHAVTTYPVSTGATETAADGGGKAKKFSGVKDGPRFRRKPRGKIYGWVPKTKSMNRRKSDEVFVVGDCVNNPSSPPAMPERRGIQLPISQKTTLMIRNIPNQYRRSTMLEFLDVLCQDQNQKTELESEALHFEYDFLYLPIDFGTGDNYGYSFVNFTSATAAERIADSLQNQKWNPLKNSRGIVCLSKKICEVTWANIQGKEELVKHFQNSKFMCDNVECLPAVLSPPRNGSDFALLTNIGRYEYRAGKRRDIS